MNSNEPSEVKTPEFTPDQVNRLWHHGLHEERLFHDRLNYFSILEMGLLTVYGIMYNKEHSISFFLPLAIIGLLFTLVWLVIQSRHWSYCEHVTLRSKRLVPEFKATIDEFSEGSWSRSFSVSKVLAVSVPALFASSWLAFIVWLLVRPATVTPPETIISLDRLLMLVVIGVLIWVILKLYRLQNLLKVKSSIQ